MGDGGEVLDFKGERAGTFEKYRACIGGQKTGKARADARIEISSGYPQAPEHSFGENPCRLINGIGNQHIIARRKAREQRQRDGCNPRRGEYGIGRAFEPRDQGFEAIGEGGALPAIAIADGGIVKGIEGIENDCAAPVDRSVDETMLGAGIATGVSEKSFGTGWKSRVSFQIRHVTPASLR